MVQGLHLGWSKRLFFVWICLVSLAASLPAQESLLSDGDALLKKYFEAETAKVTQSSLADIQTLEDWTNRRAESLRQLREMLGLDPWPEKTPLATKITGTTVRDGVIVENLHFQSRPGLYVTGCLFRPETQSNPLPAILYVCGHGRVKTGDVSYGNKATYQHHGAWFAQNGYVCLIIDTIQLGEIEGIHHGTYREGMWWWHNRGYTPAGVEAWNGIRAIDYLQSRQEVDGERIGITGRSGGGAYSWWVAALDERVKVAVPVAGITSMHNHIVDGCIEGHCDCMYMVNTYAWDFPEVAALVAPRPLLISNTDKDRIFPLDGVVDVYAKTRRIYELYGALDNIGLNIAEGPHKDTQELRVNAFHWMNRFLKKDDPLIDTVATKLFTPEELKVFPELPAEERVTTIHDSFTQVDSASPPTQPTELVNLETEILEQLKRTAFRNTPQQEPQQNVDQTGSGSWKNETARLSIMNVRSDAVYSLPMYLVEPLKMKAPVSLRVIVCDEKRWAELSQDLAIGFPGAPEFQTEAKSVWEQTSTGQRLQQNRSEVLVYLTPRGVGTTAWTGDERKQTHIQRRFSLLGHTRDSLQIHDVLQCLQALQNHPEIVAEQIHLEGQGRAADWALFAALMGTGISELHLHALTCDFKEGPYLHRVSQFLSKPTAVLLAANRVQTLHFSPAKQAEIGCWSPILDAAKSLNWKDGRLVLLMK